MKKVKAMEAIMAATAVISTGAGAVPSFAADAALSAQTVQAMRVAVNADAKVQRKNRDSRKSFWRKTGCPDHLKIRAVGIRRHTMDEFLTDRGIHPFFYAGNYDRKPYRRRKRQCLYMLMMKEFEVTVWKKAYTFPDGNSADNRFDTSGPQNLWED